MRASRCSAVTSNRITDAGPPGARLTKKKVRALANNTTSAPSATRCARKRITAGAARPLRKAGAKRRSLLSQPPFADVVHRVAQPELRHALERRAQHVDLLGVPEEEIRQGLGRVRLELLVHSLPRLEVARALPLNEQVVELGILVARDVEPLAGGARVVVREDVRIAWVGPPVDRRRVLAADHILLDVGVPLHGVQVDDHADLLEVLLNERVHGLEDTTLADVHRELERLAVLLKDAVGAGLPPRLREQVLCFLHVVRILRRERWVVVRGERRS